MNKFSLFGVAVLLISGIILNGVNEYESHINKGISANMPIIYPKYEPENIDVHFQEIKRIKPKISCKKKKHYIQKWLLTAYCPCRSCSGGYGKHTSTGVLAKANHTIAVDPKVIKYGSKVEIDGITYTAEDCGGGVKGKHIDIYFDSHKEVEAFGKKYSEVYIQ